MSGFTRTTVAAEPARIPRELKNPWFNPPPVTLEMQVLVERYLQNKSGYTQLLAFMNELER